jgi:hypothetical protein
MKTAKTNKMMAGLATICLAFMFTGELKSQDKLTFTNGEEINVKVVETTPGEIKFKRSDNLEGPTHVVLKSTVFSVKYTNGSTDLFGAETKKSSPQPQQDQYGQPQPRVTDTSEFIIARPKKFGGPRIGLAIITDGTMSQNLVDKGKNPVITLMGWQFEERIFTIDNGACGLIEFVPMIGGMEQGIFLPSANLLIGLRGGGKQSAEFAMGPSLSVSGLGMVFAGGMNFRSGKINFPINIAVVPSVGSKKNVTDYNTGITSTIYFQTGWRFSITVGFNSRKK